MVRSSINRTFLLLAFLQLGLEYQSIYLFLWPLNHTCAKPPSSHQRNQTHAKQQQKWAPEHQPSTHSGDSYTFEDSRRNPIDPDAIQTNLFDAYPDDLFTRARAYSMGIKYDNIASCLQYRQEFDNKTNTSSVDLSQLETCPHGLHFEEPNQTVSVVAFFRLACSRQYLTILAPNAFALGLLAGIILPAYYLITRVASQQQYNNAFLCQPPSDLAAGRTNPPALVEARNDYQQRPAANLYYWFLVQIIAGLFIQIQTYSLSRRSFLEDTADDYDDAMRQQQQHPELYGQFVCCILLRSFIAASNLTRIIFMWNASQQEQATATRRGGSGGGGGANRETIHSSSSKEFPSSTSYELFKHNHGQFLMFSATFICFKALYAPMALRSFSSWWHLNEWLTVYSFCLTVAVFVRELLATTLNNRRDRRGAQPEAGGSLNSQLVLETNFDEADDADGIHIDADLEAGELHRCEFCSVDDHPLSIVDNPYAPTTTGNQHDNRAAAGSGNGNLWDHRVCHQVDSSAQRTLLSRSLVAQLVLVTFCLSFNYFLFQWLPDHRLLHSETTASRFLRKTSYAEDLAKAKQPSELLTYSMDQGEGNEQNSSSASAVPVLVLHDQESYLNKTSQMRKVREFDFRSRNGATQSVEAMENSRNPIEVLWITAKLSMWPLDLFVFLLHLSHLSNFESVYFKLSRLFVLVELGAKFLALEWLIMGILRRQNHLLEWEWLYTICLLAARLSATLMLFNYINTMLKLNSRLMTNKLMLFVPNTVACALALLLASYAPLLEWLDLVIMPISLIVVNLAILCLTRSLKERFRLNLCPMIFEEQQSSGLTTAQRMVLMGTNTNDTS